MVTRDIAVLAVSAGPADQALIPAELAGQPVETVVLNPGPPGGWADELRAALRARGGRRLVVWAPHRPATVIAAAEAQQFPDVVVVFTRQAAVGVIEALTAGRSVASIIHPPLPVPDQALRQAGAGADELFCGDGWRVELTDQPQPTWLTITADAVRVAAAGLTPAERAAIAERAASVERAAPAGRSATAAAPAQPDGQAGAGRRRLLIGSANYAGQGRAWAQAVTDHVPGFQALNVQLRTLAGLVFDSDCLLRSESLNDPVARVDLARELVAPATHVLLEDMRALMGTSDLRRPEISPAFGRAEAEQLLASGRRVACLVHGTAGRTPARHRAVEPWSPYWDPESDFYQVRDQLVRELAAALDGLAAPLFVATPDMLEYIDGAVWLPIVAGRDDFRPAPPWGRAAKLKVAHAPSSDVMKGSEFVDAALTRLDRAGLIDYQSVRGVPPLGVPRLLRQVDVVVDQVVLGNPATLMIQTMAAGRLAVAHIAEPTRRRYPEPLPVVEADPSNIAEVIADIAADREAYRPLAEAGPAFARRFHDGRLSADVLNRHFLSLEGAP